jgi:hypothetical protein
MCKRGRVELWKEQHAPDVFLAFSCTSAGGAVSGIRWRRGALKSPSD